MRARFVFLVASSACASLSGLDTLQVEDGGTGVDAALDVVADAGNDAATDATDTIDVTAKKDAASDGSTESGLVAVPCGTATCDGQTPVCCVTIANTWTYACVATSTSCSGQSQFPMTCASAANCNAGSICCGFPGGPTNPNAQCLGFATPSKIACDPTCTAQGAFQVGCNVQLQNCANSQKTCAISTCTLPNQPLCK